MSGDREGYLVQVFKVPALIALASLVGLVSGLLADGVWDLVSWAGLGLAVLVGIGFSLRRPRAAPAPGSRRTASDMHG
jgi:hypothetical protein